MHIIEGMKFSQNDNPNKIVTVKSVGTYYIACTVPQGKIKAIPIENFESEFTPVPDVLDVLRDKMEEHPELRLGQLITVVMTGHRCDLFNIQNDELIKLLNKDLGS